MPKKKLREVMDSALELLLEERARLAERLLLSLDEPSESEVGRLWIEEAGRRLHDYREGRTKGISADDVFRRAIDEIS